MNDLSKIKRKKLINKREFVKLAKSVKESFQIEQEYLEKIKNGRNYPAHQSPFCN